jgi:MFS family permease
MSTVKAIIILMFATVAILLLVTFTRSTLIFFVFSFIFGITNAGTRVLRITYLFHHVPNPLIGRVNSTLNVISVLCRILLSAIFSFAFFLRGDNIIWTYFFCALFLVINVVLMATKYRELVKDYKVPEMVEVEG